MWRMNECAGASAEPNFGDFCWLMTFLALIMSWLLPENTLIELLGIGGGALRPGDPLQAP